jgi:hypothetical protein
LCGVLGIVAGLFAPGTNHPPAYALDSMFVYRGEIGLVSFGTLYLVAILTRLAYYGRMPTSIGASGAQLPDVGLVSNALDSSQATAMLVRELRRELTDELADVRARVAALDRALGESDHG